MRAFSIATPLSHLWLFVKGCSMPVPGRRIRPGAGAQPSRAATEAIWLLLFIITNMELIYARYCA